MGDNLPVILIELVLVFGGVLGFAWWQLRSVARDRREAGLKKAAQQPAEPAAQDAASATGQTGTPPPPP